MKDLGQQLVCVKVCVCAPEGASVTSSSLQPYGLYHLSMGFSRQEYWSGLPYPPPGDLPKPEIKMEPNIPFPDFPGHPVVGNLPARAGDMGLIPNPGRSHMLWGN